MRVLERMILLTHGGRKDGRKVQIGVSKTGVVSA